jgi:hypothetical protein
MPSVMLCSASVPADETCGSAIDAFNPEVVTLLR